MNSSICGIDCTKCELKDTCKGCIKTNGQPFGGDCVVAKCCQTKKQNGCHSCDNPSCGLKQNLIREFNNLNIPDMDKVTDLNLLRGSYINLEYTLPNNQVVKLLDDNQIYFGNQLAKNNSDRCYGLAANAKYILVCEYGANGVNAEIVVYKRIN